MRLVFLSLICLYFLPLKTYANGSKVLNIAKPYVVSITGFLDNKQNISGSGIIVAPNEILTNCHVVENVQLLKVRFSDKKEIDATIKGKVASMDLCAITADTGSRKSAAIVSLSEIKEGQDIYAIGNPLSLATTISGGIVSGLRQTENGKLIQFTAPISNGSSGGGLFDKNGRLIGITTFSLTKGQNINFAIPAEYKNSLGLSLTQNADGNTTDKSITFKGVPFGSSSKKFIETFNDAKCKDTSMGIICEGGRFSYLNLYAQRYFAFFNNDKLSSVIIAFNKSDSFSVAENLKNTLIGYFGQPIESTQTDTETSWEPNPNQSIELGNCEEGFLFCHSFDAAIIKLTDRIFVNEKKKSDF